MSTLLTAPSDVKPTPLEMGRSYFRTHIAPWSGRSASVVIALTIVLSGACRSETPEERGTTTQSSPHGDRAGTEMTTTAPTADSSVRQHTDFYERTQREFTLADFLKPSGDDVPEHIIAMSPLIVREVAEPYADQHFGTPIESDGRAAAPSGNPPSVIYYFEDAATIGGVERNRLTFIWVFDEKRGEDSRLMGMQGFRMTLDDKGYAIFWEVLDSRQPRIVYVAQSVEDAAASEFGPPEAPRHFSIERPLAEAPETIVPRILPDGPQPMGPFVYIECNKHVVTTLLCRCMPSQVEDFRNNQYFDLRPLPADESNNRQLLRFHELLQHADEMPLDQVLRIPSASSVVP